MVQSISTNEDLSSNFVRLTPDSKTSSSTTSNISTDFEGIIERLTSGQDDKKSEETEALNKTLAEKLKEATSKITVCPNCGAIYMGQEVTVCAKCHGDIEQTTSPAASSVSSTSES